MAPPLFLLFFAANISHPPLVFAEILGCRRFGERKNGQMWLFCRCLLLFL
jgi:hypothetical protein